MAVSAAQNVKHLLKEWLVNNELDRYGRKQLWPKSWQCPGGVSNTARNPTGFPVYSHGLNLKATKC